MNHIFSKEKSDRTINLENPIKNLLATGGDIVFEKTFDIKNYLIPVERHFNLDKKLRTTSIHNYSTFSDFLKGSKESTYLTTYNMTAHPKSLKKTIQSTNIGFNPKSIDYNSAFLNTSSSKKYETSFSNNFADNLKKNKKSSLSRKKKPIKYSIESFSVSKAIEDIKKKIQKNDTKNKLASIKTSNSHFAYDPKYADVVFDCNKLLNFHEVRKKAELKEGDDMLSTFITQNKDLSVKNVLIKLMNNESNKISLNEDKIKKRLKDNAKKLKEAEKNFEEFASLQKKTTKQIENTLVSLQEENHKLLEEEVNNKILNKILNDERQKLLEQIESLRIYAEFVNKVVGLNLEKYQNKILPDYLENSFPDYEKISLNVIKRFNCFLKNDENDIYIKKENKILGEPEILYQKYNEMENNIRRQIDSKEEEEHNLLGDSNVSKKIILELTERHNDLKKEYEKLNDFYKEDLSNYERYHFHVIQKSCGIEEYYGFIKDLYEEIIEIFYKTQTLKFTKSSRGKLTIDRFNVEEFINQIVKMLKEKEEIFNKLYSNLNNAENTDTSLFIKAVNNIKSNNKEHRQALIKQNIGLGKELQEKTNKKHERYVLIGRNSEPPYYKKKKPEKKKVDYELLKRLEEEQLLSYK